MLLNFLLQIVKNKILIVHEVTELHFVLQRSVEVTKVCLVVGKMIEQEVPGALERHQFAIILTDSLMADDFTDQGLTDYHVKQTSIKWINLLKSKSTLCRHC